jgi:hypothetical protein
MNFQMSKRNLVSSFEEFNAEWKAISEHWQDKKSAEFKKTYIDKLSLGVRYSMGSLERIDQLFKKLQEDCS